MDKQTISNANICKNEPHDALLVIKQPKRADLSSKSNKIRSFSSRLFRKALVMVTLFQSLFRSIYLICMIIFISTYSTLTELAHFDTSIEPIVTTYSASTEPIATTHIYCLPSEFTNYNAMYFPYYIIHGEMEQYKYEKYDSNVPPLICKHCENKTLYCSKVVKFIPSEHPNKCSILYCSAINEYLNKTHVKSVVYRVGLPSNQREYNQMLWTTDKIKILIATCVLHMEKDEKTDTVDSTTSIIICMMIKLFRYCLIDNRSNEIMDCINRKDNYIQYIASILNNNYAVLLFYFYSNFQLFSCVQCGSFCFCF